MFDLMFMLMIWHISLVMGYFPEFVHLSNRSQMMMEFRFLFLVRADIEVVSVEISVNWFMMRLLWVHEVWLQMV